MLWGECGLAGKNVDNEKESKIVRVISIPVYRESACIIAPEEIV